MNDLEWKTSFFAGKLYHCRVPKEPTAACGTPAWDENKFSISWDEPETFIYRVENGHYHNVEIDKGWATLVQATCIECYRRVHMVLLKVVTL